MALATDNFDRGDNASLGANWTTRQGGTDAFKILTNTATPTSYSASDLAEFYSAVASWPDNQYSQATVSGIAGTSNGTGIGVVVRCDPTNIGGGPTYLTFYWAVVNAAASNNVTVTKRVSNSDTTLGQRTQAFSDGDTLKLEVVGGTLRVYRNGVQLGADLVDATPIASGSAGIGMSAVITAGALDNWEGGAVGQTLLPDADTASGNWAAFGAASLWEATSDSSDSTYMFGTAS